MSEIKDLLLEEMPMLFVNLKAHLDDDFISTYFQLALPVDAHSIDMNLGDFS
jgi:hypothetical protein